MSKNVVRDVLAKLTAKEDLTSEEVCTDQAIRNDEISDPQIAGFQVALLMKGRPWRRLQL